MAGAGPGGSLRPKAQEAICSPGLRSCFPRRMTQAAIKGRRSFTFVHSFIQYPAA